MRTINVENIDACEKSIKSQMKDHEIYDGFISQIYDQGEGETIIFTPSFENTLFVFAQQIKLLEKKYRVIAYTRRETTSKPYITTEQQADDLIAIIEKLGLKKVNIVTLCVTSSTPLLACSKRPDLFNSLFMNNAFVYMPLSPALRILAKIIFPIIPEKIAKRIFVKTITAREDEKYTLSKIMEIKDFKKKFLYGMFPLGGTDIRKDLAFVKKPVCIINTSKDPLIPVKYTKMIHDLLPNSTFEVIKNLKGHFISLLDTELYNRKLNKFLEEVTK